jgi:hypothetical protein
MTNGHKEQYFVGSDVGEIRTKPEQIGHDMNTEENMFLCLSYRPNGAV